MIYINNFLGYQAKGSDLAKKKLSPTESKTNNCTKQTWQIFKGLAIALVAAGTITASVTLYAAGNTSTSLTVAGLGALITYLMIKNLLFNLNTKELDKNKESSTFDEVLLNKNNTNNSNNLDEPKKVPPLNIEEIKTEKAVKEVFNNILNSNLNLNQSENIKNNKNIENNGKKKIEEEENMRIEECIVKIIKNLNLNEKLFRTNVKEKGLENTEEFYLHQLRMQIEILDKKVDGVFWNTIDKLIDEKNSLADRANLYKSVSILSSKKSITPFAEALKNEKDLDKTKIILKEVLIRAGKEFEKRILNKNIESLTPEFFTGTNNTFGFLIDANNEVHIVREMFAKGGEKTIHTVTSLHSSDEYIAGIALDERSIQKEQSFLERYKNQRESHLPIKLL